MKSTACLCAYEEEGYMKMEELESVISKYRITKPKYRGKEIENKSLPFMLTTFRELIKDEVPPTQEEFIKVFKNKYPDLKLRGVTSRLKRAYLSYVREYHLGFLLKKHFKKVIYSEKADLLGVDYVIYYKRLKFNLHAYVNTENGRYWRSIKNGRHKFRGIHLDLPINLDSGKRAGKIILYTDDHVNKLKKEMDRVVLERKKKKVAKTSLES